MLEYLYRKSISGVLICNTASYFSSWGGGGVWLGIPRDIPRGAVKGGKVRTILRAHDGRGPPEGETWFLPRGTLEPCISARPRPGFDRANFHVIIQTFRLLDIHQLVMKKIAALVETTPDHAAVTESGSTVFSVQQQQRAVSADEEFCVQIHAIKLAIKPQQKLLPWVCQGEIVRRYLNYLLIN